MLPNIINFRGAVYNEVKTAGQGTVTWIKRNPGPGKPQRDPKPQGRMPPKFPDINESRLHPELVKAKQERNTLQHEVDILKARYDKTFVEYNKFADALEALPTAKTTTDKATWEVRLKSRIDGLDRDLDGIEKSIDAKLGEIAALEQQISAIKAPPVPVSTQAPIATQEVPMFKQRPSAAERNTQAIEREQALISKLQAAKLKPEWADKPEDLYKMDKMIADATKRLQDLKGETINTDLYGGSGSVG